MAAVGAVVAIGAALAAGTVAAQGISTLFTLYDKHHYVLYSLLTSFGFFILWLLIDS